MNGCWILSNAFSASIEMITWVLSFVYVVYHIDWLAYVETSLWSWDKSHFIMMYNLFMCCWIHFSNMLWGFLHLYWQRYWSLFFFFLVGVFFWFWYQGNCGYIECLWECSLPLNTFWTICEGLAWVLSMFGRICLRY